MREWEAPLHSSSYSLTSYLRESPRTNASCPPPYQSPHPHCPHLQSHADGHCHIPCEWQDRMPLKVLFGLQKDSGDKKRLTPPPWRTPRTDESSKVEWHTWSDMGLPKRERSPHNIFRGHVWAYGFQMIRERLCPPLFQQSRPFRHHAWRDTTSLYLCFQLSSFVCSLWQAQQVGD